MNRTRDEELVDALYLLDMAWARRRDEARALILAEFAALRRDLRVAAEQGTRMAKAAKELLSPGPPGEAEALGLDRALAEEVRAWDDFCKSVKEKNGDG